MATNVHADTATDEAILKVWNNVIINIVDVAILCGTYKMLCINAVQMDVNKKYCQF